MASSRTWKKQLIRVQQMADQKLGRSEKTQVLTDELLSLEKRVEDIGKACHLTSKRLKDLFGGVSPDEKKLKKMPESALAFALIESGNILEQTTLGQAMVQCGELEGFLAKEKLTLELDLERNVIGPLNTVVDVEVPAIKKQKSHLKQNSLDMDAAKSRHQSAVKAHAAGNVNAAKVEAMREEMEEALTKVEQSRDQHATDIYSFVARDAEFSKVMLQLLQLQMDYHRRAWERLQSVVPEFQEHIERSVQLPVYGQPLEDHLKLNKRKIALVIEESVRALLRFGMEEEGLFRIAGAASKVKKLRASYDSNMIDMEEFERDPHTIAGTLKSYLRELPEPLLTYSLHDEWMQAAHQPQETRLQELWTVLHKLPQDNYNNLRYLVKFLALLAENSKVNKMTTSNIAIVMGPNLLWPPPGENGPSVLHSGMQTGILDALVSNADWFFPGEIDFHHTSKIGDSPRPTRPGELKKPPEASTRKDKSPKRMSTAHGLLTAPLQKPPLPPNTRASFLADMYMGIEKNTSEGDKLSKPPSRDRTPSCEKELGQSGGGSRDTISVVSLPETERIVPENSAILKSSPGDLCRNGSSYTSGNGGLSDTVSEPGGTSSFSIASRNKQAKTASRAITPPPRPTPPKSIHSDMYNTVFALQSLGDGWSDYLTRVRGLWDGHMSKNKSSGNSKCKDTSSMGPLGGGEGAGGKSEEAFNVTGSSSGSTYNTPAPGSDDSYKVPYQILPAINTNLQNSHVEENPPPDIVASTNPFHVAPSANLQINSEPPISSSPKPTKKKKAPPPPQSKPQTSSEESKDKTNSLDRSIAKPTVSNSADQAKSGSLGRLDSVRGPHSRPTAAPPPVIPMQPLEVPGNSNIQEKPASPGQQKERPRGPPPERPVGPPPDKPPHAASPDRQGFCDAQAVTPDRTNIVTAEKPKVPPEKPAPPAVKSTTPERSEHSGAAIDKRRPSVSDKPGQTSDAVTKSSEKQDGPLDSLDMLIPPPDKPEKPPLPSDKPEKPEKPEKPPTPSGISSSASFKYSEKPDRPAKPALSEKPVIDEKPGSKSSDTSGHKRQASSGGGRPPRPQPPPPPRPLQMTEAVWKL